MVPMVYTAGLEAKLHQTYYVQWHEVQHFLLYSYSQSKEEQTCACFYNQRLKPPHTASGVLLDPET